MKGKKKKQPNEKKYIYIVADKMRRGTGDAGA